jgi:hypothetical protein
VKDAQVICEKTFGHLHSSLEAGTPGHAQIPSPITDAKIGKVFHGDVAWLLDGMK